MRIFTPSLKEDHPGFFTVLLALAFTHTGLAIDFVLPDRHESALWSVTRDVMPEIWVGAIVHALVVLMLVVGIYGPAETRRQGQFQQFYLVRAGCMLSLISFNALAVCLFFAALEHSLSFYPAIAAVSVSLTSLACFKEPRYNSFTHPLAGPPRKES